jgi:ribosome-associated protein
MSGPLNVRGSISIPEAELRWRFSRSSGPGGQHVNTSDTAAELSFDVAGSKALPALFKERALERLAGRLIDGVITIRAEEFRSQLRNREAAKARLTALLAEATAPPPRPRIAKKPSRRAKQRRLDAKRHRGDIKRGRSGRFDD